MTLLREIQTATTDKNVNISDLLRKAKILAARLRNPEFEAWVDHELNGYGDKESLPSYRLLPAMAKGTLTNGFWIWNDFGIMTTFLPDQFKDWGERCYLMQPIATIASLAERTSLTIPWPQELAAKYGAKGTTEGLECIRAWQVVNPDDLRGVLDTVRTRLLDFVLKLEAENPDAGEAELGHEPIPAERLRPLVINTFYGSVGNVAQHSHNINQSAAVGLSRDDLTRLITELSSHLQELHLDERQQKRAAAQIEMLRTELQSEPDEEVVAQAGRTLRNITEGAIGSLVAAASQPTVWLWIHHALMSFR